MPDKSGYDQKAHQPRPPLVERIPLGRLIILRLFRPTDEEVRETGAELGFELPVVPNVMPAGNARAMRLAPEEWWLFDGPSAAEISARLAGRYHLANDATAGKLAWAVSGAQATDFLNCGCSLDLDERAFPPGRCARTIVAGVSAVILRSAAPPRFEVIVDRSLGEYFQSWLIDAQIGFVP